MPSLFGVDVTAENVPGPIGFIGVGEIARAMIDGLCDGESPPEIFLSPRGHSTSGALSERHASAQVCENNQDVADAVDLLVIALPTDATPDALGELTVKPGTVLLSVVAGISVADLARYSGGDVSAVRAIPLPSVRQRRGLTPVFGTEPRATAIFDYLGGALSVPGEEAFAVLSAASATMSAHFAYMAHVVEWAASNGVPADEAELFVKSMFSGSDGDLMDRPESFAALGNEHETPNGLNQQLRESWFDASNQAALTKALDALHERVTRDD